MPENKINPDMVLSRFLDEIVAVKGAGLSKVERLSLRQDLRTEMDEKVDAAIIAALPEDKLLELNKMVESEASEDEIENFFVTAGVDFEKVALSVMLQFRKDQMGDKAAGAEVKGASDGTEALVGDAAGDLAESADKLSHDMTENTQRNDTKEQMAQDAVAQSGAAEGARMSNAEGIALMVAEMSKGGANA